MSSTFSSAPVVNQTTLRILYFRYKEYITPVLIIFVACVAFLEGVVPQIQQYLDTRDKVQSAQSRLATLQQNIAVGSGLSEQSLDKQLEITYTALPKDKDFEGVVNAIATAGINSGVKVGDYNFQVGTIGNTKNADNSISVNITILGIVDDAKRFLETLKQQLPLSDATEIHVSPTGSSVTLQFYYKQLPKITFEAGTPVTPLTQKEQKLLDSLIRGTNPQIIPISPTGQLGGQL